MAGKFPKIYYRASSEESPEKKIRQSGHKCPPLAEGNTAQVFWPCLERAKILVTFGGWVVLWKEVGQVFQRAKCGDLRKGPEKWARWSVLGPGTSVSCDRLGQTWLKRTAGPEKDLEACHPVRWYPPYLLRKDDTMQMPFIEEETVSHRSQVTCTRVPS